HAAGASR
ncbi:hypothetical protein MKD33_19965, partial [Chromobacterium piscinae]